MKKNFIYIISLAIILSGLVLCVYPVDASNQVRYLTEKELVNVQDAKTVIDKVQPYQSVKVGSSVIINTDAGDIIATPHTLTSSGWVEVQYNPKTLAGDIDVSFGFDGKHNVQITRMKGDPEVDVSKSKSLEYKSVAGTSNWQTIRTQTKAIKGQWQIVKFWVELPFSGLNPIEGKYNIEVKADKSGVGSGIVLDPWYNSAWGYRKELTVYGSNVGVQTNYQKLVRVYQANAGADMPENLAQYTTNYDGLSGTIYNGAGGQGQTFTAEATATVKKIWLYLVRTGTGCGVLTINVYLGSTNDPTTCVPAGGVLTSGTINSAYVSTSIDWYEIDLGAGTALTSGTMYCITASPAAGDAGNYLKWGCDLTAPAYTSGSAIWGGWAVDAAADRLFQAITTTTGTVPLRVDTEAHCQADFDDLRFTTSAGDALLDYWIENSATCVGDGYADCWVETDTIAQMTSLTEHTHYYLYYGNAAATAVSSGTNTFVQFDNFDSYVAGSDLNGQGGWTATAAGVVISTDHATSSANSVKIVGSAGSNTMNKALTATSQAYWIGLQSWKENAAGIYISSHGNGTSVASPYITNAEDIYFLNAAGAGVDTVLNATADAWAKVDRYSEIFTGASFVIRYANNLSATCQMYTNAGSNGVNALTDITSGAGNDTYIDDYFVGKFAVSCPLWGTAGAEESLTAPTMVTLRCTGFGDNWLLLNGNVTSYGSMVNITQLGFNYGTTASYGSTILASYTNYTLRSYGYYQYLNSLNTATMYNFRATGYNGSWGYGANRQFSTGGASVEWPWEMNVAAVNTTWQIYGSNWAFQRYTTNVTAHTLSSIDLWFTRTGSPGDVLVTTQAVGADGLPYGAALNTGTIPAQYTGNINPISSNTTTRYNVKFDKEVSLSPNTTYSFTVKALMGDTSNYIQMANVNTGTYPYGTGYRSTNSGLTWIDTDTDFLFDLWGRSCLQVDFGKVFMGYKETGDWLFVFAYDNVYPPYYPEQDSKQKFVYQLVDYYNVIKAQSPCASWGLRPGSIYLSATSVVPLQWGGAYRLRLTNIADGTVYMEYPLQSSDWQGTDMTLLDSWCLSVAQKIGTFYNTPMITSVAGRGNVLNQQGGVMFATGIPLLDSLRPNVFQIATTAAATSTATYPQTMRQAYNPAAMLGPDAFAAMTSIGNVIGVDGRTIGFAGLLMMTLVIAGWGFQPGHTIAATIIASIMFILAMLVGLLDLLIGALLLAIAAVILIWQGVFRGG